MEVNEMINQLKDQLYDIQDAHNNLLEAMEWVKNYIDELEYFALST